MAAKGPAAVRVAKEFAEFAADPPPFVTATLTTPDDVMHWRIIFEGPSYTPYRGGTFELALDLPADYPFSPPKLRLVTKLFHANVCAETGKFCTALLTREHWAPALGIKRLMIASHNMLGDPNPNDPVDAAVGRLLRDDRTAYEAEATAWTKRYAQ